MPKIMVANCGIYCSILRSIPENGLSRQISLATKDRLLHGQTMANLLPGTAPKDPKW